MFAIRCLFAHVMVCALVGCSVSRQATPAIKATEPPTVAPVTATTAPTFTAPAPTHTEIPTEALTTTPATPILVDFPFPEQARTQYELQVSLDYAAHQLFVQEQITYTNMISGLNELVLLVDARTYPGVFQLERIAWADGRRISQFYWTDSRLTVILPEPLETGESVGLQLDYRLYLFDSSKQPNIRPYPLGYTANQINLGDWYPYIPAYIPNLGWQVHKPWFYGEYLVYESADYNVAIRLEGEETKLVIAASTVAQEDGEWLRYYLPAGRSFAWSASPYYQVITQTVELRESLPVTVASYHLPLYPEAGQSLAETMTQALRVYSKLYGTFPRPLLSAVQAEFLDGMEYDGLFFLGSNFYNWFKKDPAQFLTMLGAHETAHQWWYALVGNDPALEPWLDEALCTYSERLYYEMVAPQALEWWWNYRIYYYRPGGWIDISVYDVPNRAGHYRAYRDTVYFNGALFLEELRQLVGDEAFFASLKDYAKTYAYQRASASAFFEAFQRHSSADLRQLQGKYFKNPP